MYYIVGGIILKLSDITKRILSLGTAVLTLATMSVGLFAYADNEEPTNTADEYIDSFSTENTNRALTVFNEADGLPTGEANTVLQTLDGYIWIGSYGGLIRYDGKNFRNYSSEGLIDSSSIRTLFEDSKGRLWIGTNDKGVYVMQNDTIQQLPSPVAGKYLCIRDFAEKQDGKIIVASTSGVGEIDTEALSFVTYLDDSRLFDEPVYSLAIDPADRIWACVNSGDCYVIENKKVVEIFEPNELFLEETDISSVVNDSAYNIYLGGYKYELVKVSFPADSDYSFDDIVIDSYLNHYIYTYTELNVTKDDDVLISCINGLGVLSSTGKYTEYAGIEGLTSLNCAAIDYEGNIWLASTSNGVIKMTESCFENYNQASALIDTSINAVLLSGGMYYIATDTELIICSSDWGKLENELTGLLRGVRIKHLALDSEGNIWIATYSEYGAIKYNPKTGKTTFFNSGNGIENEKINVIYPLESGEVAVGTQQGLSIIRDDKVVKTFDAENGFAATSVLCMMELGGSLYVGTDGSGIYEITADGEINVLSYTRGLLEGVVLRMCPDPDAYGNYFVSAGSSLYYYYADRNAFTKLDNFAKKPGSIYDIHINSGKVWLLQNNGIVSAYKTELLKK